MCLDEGEHHFLSGSHDQSILIWKYNQNENRVQSLITCKGHQGTIESLAVNGNVFASASFDKTIKIWGLDEVEENPSSTKECRLTLNAHNENVSSIVWNDSDQLISSSWDQTMKIWNVETLQSIQTIVRFSNCLRKKERTDCLLFRNAAKRFSVSIILR